MIFSSRSFLYKGCLFVTLGALSGAMKAGVVSPADTAPSNTSVQSVTADGDSLADAENLISADDAEPGLPRSEEGDDRLKKSDAHLRNGRDFYFKGNLTGAHREFDAAVDVLLNAPESLPDHARIKRHLEQICDLIYRFDVEKLGAGQAAAAEESFDKAPIDEISHMTFPVDEAMAAKLKTELNRTPSAIPLELSDPVLSYVHYFSTDRGRSILLAGLRRSGRYRPLIQKIFAEEGVPEELIYLAQAESGFLPRAVSNKAAVGMWQFVQFRGRQYGLMQSPNHDDRLDPEKATRSAARHLRDLYQKFGDWYLAIAGYNCGDGCVERAVQRTGYADFWEIRSRNAIPRETTNYVPIILAMTIMHKNAKDYGLTDLEPEPPLVYEN